MNTAWNSSNASSSPNNTPAQVNKNIKLRMAPPQGPCAAFCFVPDDISQGTLTQFINLREEKQTTD